MTTEDAATFLEKSAKRNHAVSFERSYIYVAGVKSHRIKGCCDKLDHDGVKVLALLSDVECSCGADKHNAKVDEALAALNSTMSLPA